MTEGTGNNATPTSGARTRQAKWAAYAASAWALMFAAVHLYWALGGTAGLPPGMSVDMNPALFVIDIVAVPLCVAGSLLALSLVRPWGRVFPGRLLLACEWVVCAILVFHSAPTLVWGALVAVGFFDVELSVLDRWSLFVYEPWFFAGGLLYGLSVWLHGRRSHRGRDSAQDGMVAGAARDDRRGGYRV